MQHLTLLDAPLDGCQDRKKTIALINHSVGVVLLRLKLAERVILELRSMSPEANAGIKINPALTRCRFVNLNTFRTINFRSKWPHSFAICNK
ncbi:hypothetical protein CEXT_283951 [Caerostris extrusa]|uniref:Uncharacterized protein n=1 Tax=Caerostris extrusa TaxID=172846 RepID=A0AAV4VSD6_CAEEX|nr:hypothetical protein CEXT_283951 [Caerostris extrusa]